MSTMGVGIDSQKVNELKQVAASYPQSKEGLLKAINERGSMDLFNKAMQKARSPLGKALLKKVGINEDVIDYISGEINSGGTTNISKPTSTATSIKSDDILDRLSKLK